MRSHNLKQDCQDNWCANNQVPSGIEFVEGSHKNVIRVVFFNLSFREAETVVSKDNYERGVDVLSKENDHHSECITLGGVLCFVDMFSNKIEEDMHKQIDQSDEGCKHPS